MAKKQQEIEQPWVRCEDCKKSIGEVVNFLVGCSDPDANPSGCKMGNYPRQCEYFKAK